jgi:hypothetical protein
LKNSPDLWSRENQRSALMQGWTIVAGEIRAFDKHWTDAQAQEFVGRRADQGDRLAQRALAFVAYCAMSRDRVFLGA